MKILVIGDLHGQMPNIHFKEFDAIISTGDICNADFLRDIQFPEIAKKMKDPSYKMKPWHGVIGKPKAKSFIKTSLVQGREILEFLNSQGVLAYLVPGNNDWTAEKSAGWEYLGGNHFKEILGGLRNIRNVHNRLVDMGDFQVIGYGLTHSPEYPQYPQDMKMFGEAQLARRRRDYMKWQKRMDNLFQKASKPVIFLSHNVPFGTKIDKILMKDSPRYGHHFGSLVVREMIEKHCPLLSVAGHMHEHYRKIKMGETVCIAAGFGADANTLVELENGRVKSVNFFKLN